MYSPHSHTGKYVAISLLVVETPLYQEGSKAINLNICKCWHSRQHRSHTLIPRCILLEVCLLQGAWDIQNLSSKRHITYSHPRWLYSIICKWRTINGVTRWSLGKIMEAFCMFSDQCVLQTFTNIQVSQYVCFSVRLLCDCKLSTSS